MKLWTFSIMLFGFVTNLWANRFTDFDKAIKVEPLLQDTIEVHRFFPERAELKEPFDINKKYAISEAENKKLIDDVIASYTDVIKAHGGRLHITNDWQSDTINAYAVKTSGGIWLLNLKGGIGRLKEVTKDGVMAVLCHEAGHMLGGWPLVPTFDQMANEGQSDYFVGAGCFKRLYKDAHAENAKSRESVHPHAKEVCDAIHKTTNDQNLCYRIIMAGFNIFHSAYLVINDEKLPKWGHENRDQTVVEATKEAHPEPQCRVDTYFSSATCLHKWDDSYRPTEADFGKYSCDRSKFIDDYRVGPRPLCWFKPPKVGGTHDPRK